MNRGISPHTGNELLIVVPWLEGGGAQRALEGILRGLPTESLHLVILFGTDEYASSISNVVSRVTALGERKSPVGVLRAALKVRALVANATKVYSLMRGSHVVLGVASGQLLARRPFAATFHMLPSDDSTGRLARIENLLVRRATRHADLVTAPSTRAVTEIAEYGFAVPERVIFEANRTLGSALPPVEPRPGRLSRLRLLVACRLTDQKGLNQLPEILSRSDVPVDLTVAGDGELQEMIEGFARSVSGPHTVRYIGRTENVIELLDRTDAVLMPSRAELNPVVVWEAWDRGRPVISSDLPVFRDLAEQGPVTVCADADGYSMEFRRLAEEEETRKEAYAEGRARFTLSIAERSPLVEFFSR